MAGLGALLSHTQADPTECNPREGGRGLASQQGCVRRGHLLSLLGLECPPSPLPPVRLPCPLQLPSTCCSQSCTLGSRRVDEGLKFRWSFQELNPGALPPSWFGLGSA